MFHLPPPSASIKFIIGIFITQWSIQILQKMARRILPRVLLIILHFSLPNPYRSRGIFIRYLKMCRVFRNKTCVFLYNGTAEDRFQAIVWREQLTAYKIGKEIVKSEMGPSR